MQALDVGDQGSGVTLFGANPWPMTGTAGHAALVLMTLEALGLLSAYGLALFWGYQGVVSTDFIAYFTGATLLVKGEGHRLYDAARQFEVQQVFLQADGITSPTLITFINPPLWAAIIAPLYPLGVRAGSLVWAFVNLAVSGAILLAVARVFSDLPAGAQERRLGTGWKRATALILCFAPFLEAWYFGQMAAVMLAAFGGWFVLSRTGRPVLAGLALSLALLKPQYLVAMVVYLAWKRQWVQLGGFAIGAVVTGVLTVLVLVKDGSLPPVEALLPYTSFGGSAHNVLVELQLNIRSLIWHALPGLDANLQLGLLVGLTLAAIGGFLAAVGRDWRPAAPAFPWEILALFAFVPITAFHNNLLHLYLLLPPLVVLLTAPPSAFPDRRYGPALGWLLGLPSVGIILRLTVSPYCYYVVAWIVAIGAIFLGLSAVWFMMQPARVRQGPSSAGCDGTPPPQQGSRPRP